jgi:hypothetical protein
MTVSFPRLIEVGHLARGRTKVGCLVGQTPLVHVKFWMGVGVGKSTIDWQGVQVRV